MLHRVRSWVTLAALLTASGCTSSSSSTAPEPVGALTTGSARSPSSGATTAAASTAAASSTAATTAPPPSPDSFIDAAAWAPSGDRIAVWCSRACAHAAEAPLPIHVADLPSGLTRTALIADPGGDGFLRSASFSGKGNLLVAAAGNDIAILKTADLSPVAKLSQMAVYGVMGVSPDEKYFAWADAYGFAEVVDLATGKGLGRASLHDPNAGMNQQLAWIPNSPRVVFGCQEGCTPELWGTKGKRISRLAVDGAPWSESQLLATPAGAVVVAASDGLVALFDGKDGKGVVLRKADKRTNPNEPVMIRASAALSGDGKKLVVGRTTGELTVFDLETKKATPVFAASESALSIEWLVVSHDGARIAFGNPTVLQEVRVGEKATSERLSGFPQGYSAEGVLVVRGKDHVVGLVDGKEKWRRPLANAAILGEPAADAVSFSNDRKVVAIADGSLHLVRTADGKSATLALDPKAAARSLTPRPGTTGADVADVLGK